MIISHAWHVMWACGCDDAQVRAADLPFDCPEHGAEQVAPPARLPAQPGCSVQVGHDCNRPTVGADHA